MSIVSNFMSQMSEELQIKVSAFNSFAVLDKVETLQQHGRYLVWKREMSKILKMVAFWTSIEQPDEPDTTQAKKTIWAQCNENTFHILKYMVTGDVYDEIEHYTNSSVAWNLLAYMFKPRGAEFLHNVFQHLDGLTWKDCNSYTEYITKFQAPVNKLCSFSSVFKIHDNFFIYKFQSNLGPKNSSYFEGYS